MLLKIKQESSGWPTNCDTSEQKEEYIREYFDREGIKLDPDLISKNPGRRQVAKLALNSLWGRYVLKNPHSLLTLFTNIFQIIYNFLFILDSE